ncbi:hypothetical protein BHE74_00039713 [Ensete ventricosum]|nr:hypothetical protein BHE74_00039713 [Ensete ventricosum]
MTVFHFFNYAILTFGPHAVYYSATPLSEYDTIGTSVEAAIVYLGTALGKVREHNSAVVAITHGYLRAKWPCENVVVAYGMGSHLREATVARV